MFRMQKTFNKHYKRDHDKKATNWSYRG